MVSHLIKLLAVVWMKLVEIPAGQMSSVAVSFEESLDNLAVESALGFVYLFISNGFGFEALNLTSHLGLPYHLPSFSGYTETLSTVEYNNSCAYKCAEYLEMICPINGPAPAILSHIHKPPHPPPTGCKTLTF